MLTITNDQFATRRIEESELDQYPGWLVIAGDDAGLSDEEIEDLARRYDAYAWSDFFNIHRPQGDPHEWFLRARNIWPCYFFGCIPEVDYPRGDCTCAKPRTGNRMVHCFECGGIP